MHHGRLPPGRRVLLRPPGPHHGGQVWRLSRIRHRVPLHRGTLPHSAPKLRGRPLFHLRPAGRDLRPLGHRPGHCVAAAAVPDHRGVFAARGTGGLLAAGDGRQGAAGHHGGSFGHLEI